MMKCILLLMLIHVAWIIEAEKEISINKKPIKKKRGECVTFEGEHNYQTNDTFKWKRDTITMVSGGRISISGDRGKTIEIRRLEESDTAFYSAMIHTARGLEITRHRLVVRGCDVNEKEIEFNGCETACKEKVISINKRLIKKKRGECVTFEGEHYYQTNDTFKWKKRETTTMVSGGRISISGDRGKTVEIRRLEESDTALYSAMIHTAGGLEITRHWLVVRGCDVNEKEIDFNGCETACKAMCLEGWHHFDDKCYRYFPQPRTWLSAYYYCQGQFGAKLATVDSSEENDFVGHLLMTGSGGWIGLNDRSKESRFLWNYNKFDQPAFFAWDKGDGKNPEPNNFNGQCNVENCVEMNSVNKKWNDVVCKAHRSYVCERPFAEDLPSDWTCVDDNCYLYVRDAVTWDWARKTCIEKNATLVTISSASKNSLVGRLTKTNIWIGLNDRVEADIYVWNDIGQGQFDNKPSYLNWDREEPNDKHYDRFTPQRCDGEDCVQINIWNGVVTWFDLNCDIVLPFVCEKSRDPYLSFAAWIAISMGAGLILSVFGGRAYMEFKHRKGRKELKQMIVEATENEERKDL